MKEEGRSFFIGVLQGFQMSAFWTIWIWLNERECVDVSSSRNFNTLSLLLALKLPLYCTELQTRHFAGRSHVPASKKKKEKKKVKLLCLSSLWCRFLISA